LGLFITFEGGEGCGKSTQARILWKKLHQQGVPSLLVREPGSTALSNGIRRLLKKRDGCSISPEAELFLFVAARAQLVSEVICPALEEGKVVVCDRFYHSTIVYQGYGRELDIPNVRAINEMATHKIKPDLVILLDISPEEGLARKRGEGDRFEAEDMPFHQRVREGYLRVLESESTRQLSINGTLPRTQISRIIWLKVKQLLSPGQA
jgi:dTMP kinase